MLLVLSACRGGRVAASDGELRVGPAALEFPLAWAGYEQVLPATVTNTGAAGVTAGLAVSPPWFVEQPQVVVPGGASVQVPLHFHPQAAGTFSATLTVSTASQQLQLPLSGEAHTPIACPASDECRPSRFDPLTGSCVEAVAADGVGCGASDLCLVGGHCQAGSCVGAAQDCDDHDACTQDSCSPQQGCLHLDVSQACPTPGGACEVARCDAATGCGVAQAADGARCGASDCQTAQVCVSGACVARAVPEGAVCAPASVCQGTGVCRGQVCERPGPAPLQPVWTRTPASGRGLLFKGHVDLDGNVYFFEWTNTPNLNSPGYDDWKNIELVSVDADGRSRFSVPLLSSCFYGCGYYLRMALDVDGQRLFVVPGYQPKLQARSLLSGRPLWERDPTAGLPVLNPGSNGKGVFSVSEPVLLGGGALVGVQVVEGSSDHWTYLVTFDRASGQPSWRVSKKGHAYGVGAWGSGDFGISSANCWAPSGNVAHFAAGGVQQREQFFSGGAQAFSAEGVFVAGYPSSELVPSTGAAVTLAPPTGEGFRAPTLMSGTRLLADSAGPGGYSLSEFDTRSGTRRWNAPLGDIGLPDLVLLHSGAVFAAAASGDAGVVMSVDVHGAEQLRCPLPAAPASPGAVRLGRYVVQLDGSLSAFELPGLDTASTGWVTEHGSPARDLRAH